MWHPTVMPLIEPPSDSAKLEDGFVSRSRSKPAKRSMTIFRNGMTLPVHTSFRDAVQQAT